MESTSFVSLLLQNKHEAVVRDGITVACVKNAKAGFTLAQSLLSGLVDRRTLLLLSGGKTPKELYQSLAYEGKLLPGGVTLVDERYGPRFHQNSNERMLGETGLLSYLEKQNISFYPILQDLGETGIEQTSLQFDETMRYLLNNFPKSLAVLGIGLDGHTAGIAGNRQDFQNPMFDPAQKSLFASHFDDKVGMFKERISLTFLGLSMLDMFIILVFGKEKKKALQLMFEQGSEEEMPARFFKRAEIAKKTLLITDQKV